MFLTDNDGRITLPGRHKVTRVFDADAGALPVGWTVGAAATEDTGVASVWQSGDAGPPGLLLTSGTATGTSSTQRRRAALIGPSFDASKCSGVRLRAVFTGGAVTNVLPRLGLSSTTGLSTVGATLLHQTAAGQCKLFTNGSAGSTNREVPFKWIPSVRHVLTMFWIPKEGYIAVAVEDDAVFYMEKLDPVTTLQAGSVQPIVGATAQANGLVASGVVHRLELDMHYA